MSNGLQIPEQFINIVDVGRFDQSIRNMHIHESLRAMSSSFSDFKEQIVQKVFIEKLEVDKTECITVVDPEFALHINKLRYSNAEPLKNLIVAVGPWHYETYGRKPIK